MARLSSRPPGKSKPPIQVSVNGPLARNPSFVRKSAAVAKQLAKSAPRPVGKSVAKTRGGRNSEDPLSGPLLR